MHEPDMLMLLKRFIPPSPSFLVQRAVRVFMHVLNRAPVRDHERFRRAMGIFAREAC